MLKKLMYGKGTSLTLLVRLPLLNSGRTSCSVTEALGSAGSESQMAAFTGCVPCPEPRSSETVLQCSGDIAQCRAKLFCAALQLLPVWMLHEPSAERGVCTLDDLLSEEIGGIQARMVWEVEEHFSGKVGNETEFIQDPAEMAAARAGPPSVVVICSDYTERGSE